MHNWLISWQHLKLIEIEAIQMRDKCDRMSERLNKSASSTTILLRAAKELEAKKQALKTKQSYATAYLKRYSLDPEDSRILEYVWDIFDV